MYTPIISKLYDNDVLSSAEYIADVLQNPAAANRLVDEAKKKFIEVLENPKYRPLVYDEYLANLGYRFAIVKNHLLFYIIDNDNKQVKIIRFLHGRQDWMNILKEKTVEEMIKRALNIFCVKRKISHNGTLSP